MQALNLSRQPNSRLVDKTQTQQPHHATTGILAPGIPNLPSEPEIKLSLATHSAALVHSLSSYQKIAAGILLTAALTAATHWLVQAPSAMSLVTQTIPAPPSLKPITPPELSRTALESANQPTSTHAAETNIAPADKKMSVPPPHEPEEHQTEISVHLPTEPIKVEQRLNNAYTAYQNGEYTAAWAQYLEVLAREEDNLDALIGLATIAAQQKHNTLALAYYQRAIKLDPQNTTALASISKYSGADSAIKESQLKQLILKNPDAVEPYFALGNEYASSGRWPEALKAYSSAFAISPENSLVTFNLAVALDHLGQYKTAAKYYQLALDHSSPESAEIDRSHAHQRIAELNALD